MSDDLEPRLRDAFRRASLPAAPARLAAELERVPDAPVTGRSSRSGRSLWAPLAVAAVLVVASAAVLSGGQHGIVPVPTLAVSTTAPSPAPSAELSAQASRPLRIVYQALPIGGVQPGSADTEVIAGIIKRRLYSVGTRDAVVSSGDDGLVVELPAVNDPERFRTLIGQTGRIDFVPLGREPREIGAIIDPTTFPALFGGDQIASATVETSGRTLTFVLTQAGARLFGAYTASHIGETFAIVVDDKLVTAPTIMEAIPGGHVQVTTGGVDGFSVERALDLVATFGSGVLPFPLREVSVEGASASPTAP
jgi:hypothetical protein